MSNILKMVQIARRELAMDDDIYRDLLESITGKRSAKGLTDTQLSKVLDAMKSKGFKPMRKKQPRAPQVAKIKAIWLTMHDQGFIESKTDVSINAYAKRMTSVTNRQGVDKIEWLTEKQATYVLESLKRWHVRVMCSVIANNGDKTPVQNGRYTPMGYNDLAVYFQDNYVKGDRDE